MLQERELTIANNNCVLASRDRMPPVPTCIGMH